MATIVNVFAGEYDLRHQERLRADLDALRADPRDLVLDMSAVTYLDSTFVTELIRLHNMRAIHGVGRLTIVRVAPNVKRIFALLRIGTFCRLTDTLDEALAPFGKPIVIQPCCKGDDSAPPHYVDSPNAFPAAWISRVLTAAGA